jgi:hypothetical protein
MSFLQINVEPNHTTLAGHCYEHDIVMASAYGMLGSVDSNTGSPDLGWDTDQFPMDVKNTTLVMKVSFCLILPHFKLWIFNFLWQCYLEGTVVHLLEFWALCRSLGMQHITASWPRASSWIGAHCQKSLNSPLHMRRPDLSGIKIPVKKTI